MQNRRRSVAPPSARPSLRFALSRPCDEKKRPFPCVNHALPAIQRPIPALSLPRSFLRRRPRLHSAVHAVAARSNTRARRAVRNGNGSKERKGGGGRVGHPINGLGPPSVDCCHRVTAAAVATLNRTHPPPAFVSSSNLEVEILGLETNEGDVRTKEHQ